MPPTGSGSVPPLIGVGAWVTPPLLEVTWGNVPLAATIIFSNTWVSGKLKG